MNASLSALAALEFSPLIPLPWLLALLAAGALSTSVALWRQGVGTGWRLLALAAVLATLAGPRLVAEQRQTLPDIVLVVVDDSPSQRLGDRPAQTEQALAQLRERLARLPNLDVRIRRSAGGIDGTKLFEATQAALADLPRRRLAGIIMITDGRVHDQPGAVLPAPLHVLLTGQPEERDRRVVITRAPGFALVGRNAQIKLRIDDAGHDGSAAITVRVDGVTFLTSTLPLNREIAIEVPVHHAGSAIIEVGTDVPNGDLLPANNRTAIAIPVIRDRLKVLLISGEPHAGERVWRNLLKSDPAVDLVHFTILRPPEKDDRTPIRELALITFPVRELFEEKLKDFDLVVFDRYRHRGIMAASYYHLLTQYVRSGGALLTAVGPEYAETDSISDSALGGILPATPDGKLLETPFVPTPTALGQRHPVTSGLPDPAAWGPWLRQISVVQNRGQALLTGADGKPLLVLDQVGEGRVAQVLSDTIWLWARGFQGGGPHDELLRRLAHWLMHEPELEAESLSAAIQGGQLRVTQRSLAAEGAEAAITAPDGTTATMPLADQGDGRWLGTLNATQPGLWTIRVGAHTALAAQGSLNNPEWAEVTASTSPLTPAVDASGGSIRFLARDGLPDIRQIGNNAATTGPHWLGLLRREDYVVQGIRQTPLLPAALMLIVAAGALVLGWKRESR